MVRVEATACLFFWGGLLLVALIRWGTLWVAEGMKAGAGRGAYETSHLHAGRLDGWWGQCWDRSVWDCMFISALNKMAKQV